MTSPKTIARRALDAILFNSSRFHLEQVNRAAARGDPRANEHHAGLSLRRPVPVFRKNRSGVLVQLGAAPSSTPPCMKATFTTTGLNTVSLILTSSPSVASEFIDDVNFNVDPSILPSAMTITQNTEPAVNAINNSR